MNDSDCNTCHPFKSSMFIEYGWFNEMTMIYSLVRTLGLISTAVFFPTYIRIRTECSEPLTCSMTRIEHSIRT